MTAKYPFSKTNSRSMYYTSGTIEIDGEDVDVVLSGEVNPDSDEYGKFLDIEVDEVFRDLGDGKFTSVDVEALDADTMDYLRDCLDSEFEDRRE